MRVQIVDPAAQTPPYDRSLAAALARSGCDVELVTSRFAHAEAPSPDGYRVRESFYPHAARLPSGSLRRRALGLAEHVPGMLRARRGARAGGADVVHYQWLTLPALDAWLLPRDPARVLTAHGFLRPSESRGRGLARALGQMDAIVALSRFGAGLLVEVGVPAEKVEVIPHGALDYLTRQPADAQLPPELTDVTDAPVVLAFGLIRPYKGVDLLLRAFAELGETAAELWIVGRPLGVDLAELERLASVAPGRVRLVPRYVSDNETAALFRRASVVALPYREVEQSGVLYTALAFGRAIVASELGGFPEVAAEGGALRLVRPGDVGELAGALASVLDDDAERRRLEAAAGAAAAGPYSWDAVGERTVALYRRLRDR